MRRRKRKRKSAIIIVPVLILIISLIGIWFVFERGMWKQTKKTAEDKISVQKENVEIKEEKEKPVETKSEKEKQIDLLVEGMSLEEKVYQMFFVTPEALTGAEQVTTAGEQTREMLNGSPVGGIVLFKQNIKSEQQVSQLISDLQSYSKIPLFFSIDEASFVNILNKKLPTTLTTVMITDYLKNELEPKGIVITDSLSKEIITGQSTTQNAALKAVEEGADMLLMPGSLEKAHGAIVSAVNGGQLTEERINESVRKILMLKFSE